MDDNRAPPLPEAAASGGSPCNPTTHVLAQGSSRLASPHRFWIELRLFHISPRPETTPPGRFIGGSAPSELRPSPSALLPSPISRPIPAAVLCAKLDRTGMLASCPLRPYCGAPLPLLLLFPPSPPPPRSRMPASAASRCPTLPTTCVCVCVRACVRVRVCGPCIF